MPGQPFFGAGFALGAGFAFGAGFPLAARGGGAAADRGGFRADEADEPVRWAEAATGRTVKLDAAADLVAAVDGLRSGGVVTAGADG
ncbi:hypothetical protein AB0J83_41300, partial [Actinoplanes sp. NPDC049596]|uniref:hypothetical protein n=1 Tax=Actinoplanes sp. NPDC049596 TaxID=3154625 RepID=UPI003438A5FE